MARNTNLGNYAQVHLECRVLGHQWSYEWIQVERLDGKRVRTGLITCQRVVNGRRCEHTRDDVIDSRGERAAPARYTRSKDFAIALGDEFATRKQLNRAAKVELTDRIIKKGRK